MEKMKIGRALLKRWSRSAGALLAAVFLAASFVGVSAHGGLANSHPDDGAILAQSPLEVRAWFEGELDTSASRMVLLDGQEKVVEAEGGVDLDDLERRSMFIKLTRTLAAGEYSVRWTAVNVEDGDKTEGRFTFTVLAGTGELKSARTTKNLAGWIIVGVISGLILILSSASLQKWMRASAGVSLDRLG